MRRVSLAVLVLGLLSIGGGLIGQDKKEAPKDDAKVKGALPFGWGKANLGLTDEQKQKIYSIDNKYDAEIESLKKKMDDLKKKKIDEQVAVLTAEQKKKLEDYFKSKAGGEKK
jgi:Spy/CpxP family protein refolding chaperone